MVAGGGGGGGGGLRHDEARVLGGLVGAEALEDGRAQDARRGDLRVLDLDDKVGADEGRALSFGRGLGEGGGICGKGVELGAQVHEHGVRETAAGAATVGQGAIFLASGEEEGAEGGLAQALAGGEAAHDEVGGLSRLDLGPRVGALAGEVAAPATLCYDPLKAQGDGAVVGLPALGREVLDEGNGPDRHKGTGERLFALLEDDARQVEAVEVEQVEGHVGHGDARLGGSHIEFTGEVHALLEELKGGDAALVEGADLAVEDGFGDGLGGEGGDKAGIGGGEVGAATGVEAGLAGGDVGDGADAVQLRLEEPVGVGEGLAYGGHHRGEGVGEGGGLRAVEGVGGVVGGGLAVAGEAAGADVVEGEAGDDGAILFGEVGLGIGVGVVVLEEEPVGGGLDQRPGALELAAAHLDRDLADLDGGLHGRLRFLAGGEVEDAVVLGGVGARVPDNDLARAVLPLRDDAFEGGVGDGVVLGHDGVAADGGVAGGAAGHGPRLHHAADLEAQVVVEAGRVVLLDDEGEGAGAPLGDGVGGLGGSREVALLAVLVELFGHGATKC